MRRTRRTPRPPWTSALSAFTSSGRTGCSRADHLHVLTGGQGEARRLGAVGGEAVLDELMDGRIVAHHEAVEAPLLAQDAVRVHGFAEAGMPLTSLKELMNVATPASTAALKGGK